VTDYGCSKQALHRVYPDDAQPICEPGATLDVVPDDDSAEFAALYEQVRDGKTTVRRQETQAVEA